MKKFKETDFGKKWKAKSPRRNKKITNICVTAVAIASVVSTLPLIGIAVPATLLTYAGVTVAVGAALGVKSKTTVEAGEDVKGEE